MKFRISFRPKIGEVYYVDFKDTNSIAEYVGRIRVKEKSKTYPRYGGVNRGWWECELLDKYTFVRGNSVGRGTDITTYYIDEKSFKLK